MGTVNQALLIADMKQDEGYMPFLYDDANRAPIKAGYTVRGHPTAGYGLALDVAPLTEEESTLVLGLRASRITSTLLADLAWAGMLSEPRQRALANMAYALGIEGLLAFHNFLQFMQRAQFDSAADDLNATTWAHQVGERAIRIETLIRNG